MRIQGEGLGSRGLASSLAVREGRLCSLSVRGLSLSATIGLGELLSAIAMGASRYGSPCSGAATCPGLGHIHGMCKCQRNIAL